MLEEVSIKSDGFFSEISDKYLSTISWKTATGILQIIPGKTPEGISEKKQL